MGWQIVENRFHCLMMLPAGLVWESRATFGSIKDNSNWKGWGQFKDNLPFLWLPTFKRVAQLAVVKLVFSFTEMTLQWLLPIRAWNADCLVQFLWVLFLSYYLSAEEDMNVQSFLRGEVSQSTKSCEFKQIDLKDLAKIKKPTHPKQTAGSLYW